VTATIDAPNTGSTTWARRVAREWLWFVGTVIAGVPLRALFSPEWNSDTVVVGAVVGAVLAYPATIIARLTWWSWRTVRPGRLAVPAPHLVPRGFTASPVLSKPSASVFIYVLAAYLVGLLSAVASGFTGAQLLGAAAGPMVFWGILAAIAKYFRPTVHVAGWMFWGSVISFVVSGLTKT
jgi:hypothetical protein